MSARIIRICLVCAIWVPAIGLCAGTGPTATVATAPVTRSALENTLVVYGQVQADPDYVVSLAPPRAGRVTQVSVRLGQRVKPGDKVLSLETAPDTRARFEQARAAVDYAQSQLARNQRLRSEQLATRDQLHAAKRSLADARSKLKSLQQIGAGQTSSAFRSPFAGVVTALNVGQGDRVQPNTAVALLAKQNRLIVMLGVEAEDARQVADSTKVTITSLFDPSIHFESRISAVHALVNQATRLVDVVVPVPDGHTSGLILNSTARGRITLGDEPTLVVPRSALQRDGNNAYVFRLRNGHAQRVDVAIKKLEGRRVSVTGPLCENDAVITTGSYQVSDGMAVRERGS